MPITQDLERAPLQIVHGHAILVFLQATDHASPVSQANSPQPLLPSPQPPASNAGLAHSLQSLQHLPPPPVRTVLLVLTEQQAPQCAPNAGMPARNTVQCALLDVGFALLVDGTELHLLHVRPDNDRLTLAGEDHTTLADVLLKHKGKFNKPQPGLREAG